MEMSVISANSAADSSCCRQPTVSTGALASMQARVCSSNSGACNCNSLIRVAVVKQNMPEFHRKLPLSK